MQRDFSVGHLKSFASMPVLPAMDGSLLNGLDVISAWQSICKGGEWS